MTDWIEHDGGPQPVADDVMVEVCATVDYTVNLDDGLQLSQFAPWARKFKYRILNQHLIDAARLEGIRLGLEAAAKEASDCATDCAQEGLPDSALIFAQHADDIRALNPDTIAREATLDTLTAEAQAQNMGYDNDDAKKARERERKRKALRELTKLTEEFGGYEELKGDNEETSR